MRHKEKIWVEKWWWVTLNWGCPMLLLDLAHLHVLPELGQAVMANYTCLLLRDRHAQVDYGQFALKTNLKGDW